MSEDVMGSYDTVMLLEQQDYLSSESTPPSPYINSVVRGPSIGAGGFSQVYAMVDSSTGRTYALKRLMLRPQWSAVVREQARACVQREAEILARLDHPHIPRAYAYRVGTGDMLMDYIPGQTLQELLTRSGQPMAEQQALAYARVVCEVLIYLHDALPAPIIHGDIKPANLLLDAAARLWVIDFGLAHECRHHQPHEITELIMGTPGYTPIEQWQGAATPRSDVYALAATLYTLLTSQRLSVKPKHRSASRQRFPKVRPLVERLIWDGLAPCAADRPTASEFLSAINAL